MNEDIIATKRALLEALDLMHKGRHEQAQAKMLEAMTTLVEAVEALEKKAQRKK